MSVVVRHPDGSIRVYSKGADSKMKPRLAGRLYFLFKFFFYNNNNIYFKFYFRC